jgi:hypothetical protein
LIIVSGTAAIAAALLTIAKWLARIDESAKKQAVGDRS